MVKLRCAAAGNPEPNITWTKDGGEINRNVGKVTFRKWAIVLEDLVPKDSGHYTCELCNVFGCIKHRTRLDVKGTYIARIFFFIYYINHNCQRIVFVLSPILFKAKGPKVNYV